MSQHVGPWPSDPLATLDCDDCGREVKRADEWHAWWNPYGVAGWTFVCSLCRDARLSRPLYSA